MHIENGNATNLCHKRNKNGSCNIYLQNCSIVIGGLKIGFNRSNTAITENKNALTNKYNVQNIPYPRKFEVVVPAYWVKYQTFENQYEITHPSTK